MLVMKYLFSEHTLTCCMYHFLCMTQVPSGELRAIALQNTELQDSARAYKRRLGFQFSFTVDYFYFLLPSFFLFSLLYFLLLFPPFQSLYFCPTRTPLKYTPLRIQLHTHWMQLLPMCSWLV